MLPPFDPDRYRKTVLARLLAAGRDGGDPFEVYDLPLDSLHLLGDEEVAARVDAVWAFWQRSREHPKYGGLVTALLAGHRTVAPRLLDRSARMALAAQAGATRVATDAARFAEVDAAIERLVERFGGVPASKVDGLRRLASASAVSEAELDARLARVTVLPDRPAPDRLAALPADVVRQVRADLDELGRLSGAPAPATLYDLLGLPPLARRDEVAHRRDALATRNRERRPDRQRAVIDDLLAAVSRLLVDGDPDRYLDAVALEVADRLRPRLAAAVLVEDHLTADDAALLVDEAVAAGLDHGRAHGVVARLAAEQGVPMPVVAVRHPNPASVPPPPMRPSAPADAGSWHDALSRARAALRAGLLGAAREQVTLARRLAGEGLPPIRAMDEEVDAVFAEVRARWAAIESAVPARRYVEAAAALDRVLTIARDLSGPAGEDPASMLNDVRRRVEAADAAVAQAVTLDRAARERALRAVLEQVADHRGAQEALDALTAAPVVAVSGDRGRACFRYPPGLALRGPDGRVVEEVDDGVAVDPAPRAGVGTYTLLDGDREVGSVAYVVLPPITGLAARGGRLTFSWPPGCTEVLVEWDGGSRKVTNSRYDVDGGVPLPESRPLLVQVRPCTRVGGVLHPATEVPRGSRLRLG